MAHADESLYSETVTGPRKKIFVDLKRNEAGVYLKIKERGRQGRHVLLPAGPTELLALRCALDGALNTAAGQREVSSSVDSGRTPGRKRKRASSIKEREPRSEQIKHEAENTRATTDEASHPSIFVAELPWTATWKDLKALCKRVGVEVVHIEARTQTHQSKICAKTNKRMFRYRS